MSQTELWWKQPLRVIQTNLQVRDTARMDPAKIAQETLDMGGNVLVTNVGGIYAWYPTKVEGHYVNRYLPKDYDLLKALIDECHARGIRLIARFDFSKTDDSNYQKRPKWFRRLPGNKPHITAPDRPGEEWPLLMDTCINGAYRNEAVAMPVIREVLERYDIDGIFYNAPHGAPCCCDICKKKYRELYGKALPLSPELYDQRSLMKAYFGGELKEPTEPKERFEPDWFSRCLRDNMDKLYGLVKSIRPELPMVLYYGIYHDSLYDRIATCDMLCTEPQDVLSLGWKNIPQFWKPALSIRLGRSEPSLPMPFGIIHSCPGMDWRHTGLPPAEYLFWMCQVPANGGMIWHSITGFADTIMDKRILDCVSTVNHWIEKVEGEMHGATSIAQTALAWNMGASAEGWAETLINRQVQFDVLLEEQASAGRMNDYELIIIPSGFEMTQGFAGALRDFVNSGGKALIEGKIDPELDTVFELAGIENDLYASESMVASYLRFEGDKLNDTFERTPIIAHRGPVYYATPRAGTEVLATFVPPFSPPEGVGAPPERASIIHPYTDIPLITLAKAGKGQVMFVAYEFSGMVKEYKLAELYHLGGNMINALLGDALNMESTHVNGLQLIGYRKGNKVLAHLLNGVGQRPLSDNVPLHDVWVKVRLPEGASGCTCVCAISGENAPVEIKDGWAVATLSKLDIWEMLVFSFA